VASDVLQNMIVHFQKTQFGETCIHMFWKLMIKLVKRNLLKYAVLKMAGVKLTCNFLSPVALAPDMSALINKHCMNV